MSEEANPSRAALIKRLLAAKGLRARAPWETAMLRAAERLSFEKLAGYRFELGRRSNLRETLASNLAFLPDGRIESCGFVSTRLWDVEDYRWSIDSGPLVLLSDGDYTVFSFDRCDEKLGYYEGLSGLDQEVYFVRRVESGPPRIARKSTETTRGQGLAVQGLTGRTFTLSAASNRGLDGFELCPDGLIRGVDGSERRWIGDHFSWDVWPDDCLTLRDIYGNASSRFETRCVSDIAPIRIEGICASTGETQVLEETSRPGAFARPRRVGTEDATGGRNRVLFNLVSMGTWGDQSSALGYMAWLKGRGYSISILTGNWGNPPKDPQLPYDPLADNRSRTIGYLSYHPHVEPVDFFRNIVAPTMDAAYQDIETGVGESDLFTRPYEKRLTLGYRNATPHYYWLRFIDEQARFDYKISSELVDENFTRIEDELRKTRNVVLYATWDMEQKHEAIDDRLWGYRIPRSRFDRMRELVLRIDRFCLEQPEHRIVLFSKKAVDWSKILRSRYLDLRDFEALGLSFAQAFYLCARNCVATVGQCSSMQLWFNFQKNIRSIVFTDDLRNANGDEGTHVRALDYYLVNEDTEDVAGIFA